MPLTSRPVSKKAAARLTGLRPSPTSRVVIAVGSVMGRWAGESPGVEAVAAGLGLVVGSGRTGLGRP